MKKAGIWKSYTIFGLILHVMIHYRLEDIGTTAAKEYSLEKALSKMKSEWKGICFDFIAYRDTVCTLLLIHLYLKLKL